VHYHVKQENVRGCFSNAVYNAGCYVPGISVNS